MTGTETPGRGSWVLDTTHFTQPVTLFTRELFSRPVERGFRDGTRPYGLLLDHIAWGFVHHWPYLSPRPVPELRTTDQLSRAKWDRLVDESPGLAERLATSSSVFATKRWRADVDWWDREVKPRTIRGHEDLARVDPRALGPEALIGHLHRCRRNLRNALYRHHRFNVAAVIAVGDLIVHTEDWTGRPGDDVLGLLRGWTPLHLGAGDELGAAADALRADGATAVALEGGGDPGLVLASLRSRPSPTGRAVGDYLDRVGDRPVGSGADIGDPRLAEVPGLLLRTLAAAVDIRPPAPRDVVDRTAELRRAVPAAHRQTFDDFLGDARATYRLRDERATFGDVWAFGLARRGVLVAGERLAEAGLVREPVHLVEAGFGEMRSLLGPERPPLAETLAQRARDRAGASFADAAPFIGPPPRPPVPVEWLPEGAARTERAFRAYVAAMSATEGSAGDEDSRLRGMGASPGRHEGTARIVHGADDLVRIEQGDVLVARSTSPAYNVVLPLLGAIVTDSGGVLSHAAIVARDYGIPAVVGAGDATSQIVDGRRVLVDGDVGEVYVLR